MGCPLAVLKFGGSVLTDPDALHLAIHEVYGWRRKGWQVIAVVSAFSGETDQLVEEAKSAGASIADSEFALLAGMGEPRTAALFSLACRESGIPARVLLPHQISLAAEGEPGDAQLVSVDAGKLRGLLDKTGVAVIPGYVALGADDEPSVLGRGGSDLTALFLGARLKAAECALIKDVDGLYTADPNRDPDAAKLATCSYEDALKLDESILQRKAILFAEESDLAFKVRSLGTGEGTGVSAKSTASAEPIAPERKTTVALLGFGTVNAGVYERLARQPDRFEVVQVAIRDLGKQREFNTPKELFTDDLFAAATCGADIVVEAIGGIEPAASALHKALQSGSSIVTANKAALAARHAVLLQEAGGAGIGDAACAGGSMPILERVRANRGQIRQVTAVISGTANFLLDRITDRVEFDEAVKQAQLHGFAESDPRRDLTGLDVADKAALIAEAAGIDDICPNRVGRQQLSEPEIQAALKEVPPDHKLRYVLEIREPGFARVSLQALPISSPLATVKNEECAAIIETKQGTEIIAGKGAGRWPTAEAVCADIYEIAKTISRDRGPALTPARSPVPSGQK